MNNREIALLRLVCMCNSIAIILLSILNAVK